MFGLADIQRRLVELENQAAFQDELHSRLNDVVARQDREISDLKNRIAELVRRLQELGEAPAGEPSGPEDEIPPHY